MDWTGTVSLLILAAMGLKTLTKVVTQELEEETLEEMIKTVLKTRNLTKFFVNASRKKDVMTNVRHLCSRTLLPSVTALTYQPL